MIRPRVAIVAIVSGVIGLAVAGAERRLPEPADVRVVAVIATAEDVSSGLGGRLKRWFGGEADPLFVRPYGVAWEGAALLITDPDAGVLVRVDARGSIEKSSSRLEEPMGVAVCGPRIVVTDAGRGEVVEFAHDLSAREVVLGGLDRPTGVVCAGSSIVVANTGRHELVVIGADGSVRTIGRRGSEPGSFNYPTSLGVIDEDILVADSMNFRIQRLDLDGTPLGAFGELGDGPGNMSRVKGIAGDPHGNVWVADAYRDEVSVYDSDGRLLMSVGGPGSTPGAFRFPAGLAISDTGMLAVADAHNRRVQVLSTGKDGRW